MQKAIRLAIALLFIFVLSVAQPAFAKPSHSSSASHHFSSSFSVHRNSANHHRSHTASSSTNQKFRNCDYPEQLDAAGHRCGNRAASIRTGGRLGGEL